MPPSLKKQVKNTPAPIQIIKFKHQNWTGFQNYLSQYRLPPSYPSQNPIVASSSPQHFPLINS